MGLAASQARLLMLTARKNDVEARLMSLANQKISLSRQSSELSQQYSEAFNAKKMVWGSGTSQSDLTFNAIMSQNNSNQYLLSDNSGRVVLDSSTAGSYGLTSATGTGTDFAGMYASKEEFAAYKLTGDKSNTAAITAVLGANPGGQGNPPSGTYFTTNYNQNQVLRQANLDITYQQSTSLTSVIDNGDNGVQSGWAGCEFQERDMYNEFTSPSRQGEIQQNFLKTLDNLINPLGSALVSNLTSNGLSSFSSQLSDAVAWAKTATKNKFLYNVNDTNSKDTNDGLGDTVSLNLYAGDNPTSQYNKGLQQGFSSNDDVGTNRITFVYDSHQGGFGNWWKWHNGCVRVDNSQIIDTFLTYFDQYCAQHFTKDNNNDGIGDGTIASSVGDTNTKRGATGGTGTANAVTTTSTSTNTGSGGTPTFNASQVYYYENLYNALASGGWTTDNNVSNSDYISAKISNGDYHLKEASAGYWTSLSTGDADSPISEEDDGNAATQAKAIYDADKDKLDIKEKMLDLESSNLDSERAEISTELESVNSILKEHYKDFKMFDA